MKRVVHISDIHFGRVNTAMVEPLILAIQELDPTIVVVSGDLTQRAHAIQFKEARKFLNRLPKPQIVIPGNHDVPFYNPLGRFVFPLSNYKRFISKDLYPFYHDDEIAIVGINTARSLTIQNGRINRDQVAEIKRRLCPLPDDIVKIVVTHHPFDIPQVRHNHRVVGRSRMAMREFATCGADIFLAGHLHITWTTSSVRRYRIDNYGALIIHAGTAISTRSRRQPNAFNLIECDHPEIRVAPYIWDDEAHQFIRGIEEKYRHTTKGWIKTERKPSAKTKEENRAQSPVRKN